MVHAKTLITSYCTVLRDRSSFTAETFFTTDNNSRVNQKWCNIGCNKERCICPPPPPPPPFFSERAVPGFVLKYFTSICFVKNFLSRKGKKINHARVCMLITRNWLFNATQTCEPREDELSLRRNFLSSLRS